MELEVETTVEAEPENAVGPTGQGHSLRARVHPRSTLVARTRPLASPRSIHEGGDMGRRTLLVAAALAVVASAAIAAPAGARTPQPTTARVVGPVVIDKKDPTVAYLKAKYRCTGEGALWISVKQTAARTKDPALTGEGSSSISAAWSMSHRNPVTCDGKAHFGHFVVDQVETAQFGSRCRRSRRAGAGCSSASSTRTTRRTGARACRSSTTGSTPSAELVARVRRAQRRPPDAPGESPPPLRWGADAAPTKRTWGMRMRMAAARNPES